MAALNIIKQNIKISLPASKSIVNRLLIIEKLSGKSFFNKKNISCDDTKVLSQVLSLKKREIDVKLSGTAMRFMTAFLSQKSGEWILNGSKSLTCRPVGELVEALKTLGAEIYYLEKVGFLPLKITGKKLNSDIVDFEQTKSSQTISALMLIAPYLDNGLIINIKKCSSFPYILLTKKIMEDCGAEVQITDNQIIIGNKKYFFDENFEVESDWDAAAFWYVFLATNENLQKIMLTNLFSNSYQPDSIVKDIFEKFGIKSFFSNCHCGLDPQSFEKQAIPAFAGITLQKKENFVLSKNFDFDFENYPDLVPIMAVTCCVLGVKFHFSGVQNLRIKESNRLDALQNELKKCGFLLTQTENSLQWLSEKCTPQQLPKIETYNDHRIAMSFAILKQKMNLEILNPNVVSKSYKNFWQHYKKFIAI